MAAPGRKLSPSAPRVRPEELGGGELGPVSQAAGLQRLTVPEEVTPGENTSRRRALLMIAEKLSAQSTKPRKPI